MLLTPTNFSSGHRFPFQYVGSGPQGQQKERSACHTRLGLERKNGGWGRSIFPSSAKPPLVSFWVSCLFLLGKLGPVLVYRLFLFIGSDPLCPFQGTDVLGTASLPCLTWSIHPVSHLNCNTEARTQKSSILCAHDKC